MEHLEVSERRETEAGEDFFFCDCETGNLGCKFSSSCFAAERVLLNSKHK